MASLGRWEEPRKSSRNRRRAGEPARLRFMITPTGRHMSGEAISTGMSEPARRSLAKAASGKMETAPSISTVRLTVSMLSNSRSGRTVTPAERKARSSALRVGRSAAKAMNFYAANSVKGTRDRRANRCEGAQTITMRSRHKTSDSKPRRGAGKATNHASARPESTAA